MRYWLDMGVDGLRLDAVPYLAEREGTNNENLADTHGILKRPTVGLDTTSRTGCSSPRPTSGRRTCAHTSATATNPTWRSTSRSCRACTWRSRARIGTRSPTSCGAGRRTSRTPPVGRLLTQPRRADAGDGHRPRTRLPLAVLRRRAASADQSRHPSSSGTTAGGGPPQDRAAE